MRFNFPIDILLAVGGTLFSFGILQMTSFTEAGDYILAVAMIIFTGSLFFLTSM